MGKSNVIEAVSYLRVSGKGQIVGHGFARQRETCAAFAKASGFSIVREYREAYTGTETDRPVFTDMLADLLSNGCRTVIVECLDRVARGVAVQCALLAGLKVEGIALYNATTGENVTEETDEIREAMVQIQGVFAELEKKRLVKKLRHAREEHRALHGRCEGRKPFGTKPGEDAVLSRLRQLARKPRGGNRLSYAEIAATLSNEGMPTRTGGPWQPRTVYGILNRTA